MLEFCWKIFIAITIGSAVSGQQITSRIFGIALASLAKISISGMPISGIYAIASISISMALDSSASARSLRAGVSFPDCAKVSGSQTIQEKVPGVFIH